MKCGNAHMWSCMTVFSGQSWPKRSLVTCTVHIFMCVFWLMQITACYGKITFLD